MMSMYLSVKMALSCWAKETEVSPAAWFSRVTRSLVKKYSSSVSGRASTDRTLIRAIHLPLSTPSMGMTTMGKISATRMPLIITVVTWLNTDRPPRWVESRVERGTIRLWLMLKMV